MKKVKMLKKWAICENSAREVKEYDFNFSVIHPDNMDEGSILGLTPQDSDIECETLEQAIEWVKNY